MTTAPDIATRVAAGAAFLDQADPEWWTQNPTTGPAIELDRLRMSDGDRCILGQRCPLELEHDDPLGHLPYTIYGHQLAGIEGKISPRALDAWAVPLGFQAGYFDPWDDDQANIEYVQLGNEWRRVITARRRAALEYARMDTTGPLVNVSQAGT